jgi:Holliday junction resolvase RusA-like endonuclease
VRRIRFLVNHPLVPKARPRVVRSKTGRPVTYTPTSTKSYEKTVAYLALAHRPDGWPLDERYAFRFEVPAATRGDLDNLTKSVLDALTGIAWKDDSQIDVLDVIRSQAFKFAWVEVTIRGDFL